MSETAIESVLPVGTRIGDYEVKRVLGTGGFGITYLAVHSKLGQEYAIKEYMPQDFSRRAGDMRVIPATSRSVSSEFSEAEMFNAGLRKFLKEARVLTRFDHPHIVRAHNYIEANDTGYIVMEYVRGQTLRRWLEKRAGRVDEQSLKNIFLPVLDGLSEIHKQGLIHRDIKPENIYLRINGSPLLLDFGTARDRVRINHQTTHIMVTSGYSPIEQYATGSNQQGPWTDVYAVGGTIYRCIHGVSPPNVMDRVSALEHGEEDPLFKHDVRAQGMYSSDVLNTVNRCLALNAKDRFQSAAEVSAGLMGATFLAPSSQRRSGVHPIDATDGDQTRKHPNSASDSWTYPSAMRNWQDRRTKDTMSDAGLNLSRPTSSLSANPSSVESKPALALVHEHSRGDPTDWSKRPTIRSYKPGKQRRVGIDKRQSEKNDTHREGAETAKSSYEPMSAGESDETSALTATKDELNLDELEWIPPSSDKYRQMHAEKPAVFDQIMRQRFVRWQNLIIFGGTMVILLVVSWMLFKSDNRNDDRVVLLPTKVADSEFSEEGSLPQNHTKNEPAFDSADGEFVQFETLALADSWYVAVSGAGPKDYINLERARLVQTPIPDSDNCESFATAFDRTDALTEKLKMNGFPISSFWVLRANGKLGICRIDKASTGRHRAKLAIGAPSRSEKAIIPLPK